MEIIVVESSEDNSFFFSKKHSNCGAPKHYIPITFQIPMRIAEREGAEDGIVRNKEQLIEVFFKGMKEIPNPMPEMQPD